MAEAIRLARRAEGRTSPNPPVGAVVVKSGQIIGRGYHHAAGTPHAEPLALENAGEQAQGADIYVTLEPCNHQGRTPPCTERVISSGIRRVFVGALDPNPKVAGSGLERLREAGLEVHTGLLEGRCQELIRPFVRHILTKRPWVVLKMATSLDGKISARPDQTQWLTGPKAKAWAHQLRDRSEAIMVGRGTATLDNPSLTTRLKNRKGQHPLRVVLDSSLSLEPTSQIVQGPRAGGPAGGGALIIGSSQASRKNESRLVKAGVRVARVESGPDGLALHQVLDLLGERGVMRLLVEGGPELAAGLIRAGLVDEYCFLLVPVVIGGREAPGSVGGNLLSDFCSARKLEFLETRRLGPDLLIRALDRGNIG